MAEKRPSLNVLSGPLAGSVFVIEDAVDNILIGSDSSCAFVIDSPGVSPIHARLWIDLNGAIVYDTNSPSGVYVNDNRVDKEAPVRNGDILWLGPPGEEGSVLIQCILPAPGPGAAARAEPAASPEDAGGVTRLDTPAYVPGEAPPVAPVEAAEEAPEDATVVMSSSALIEGIELGEPEEASLVESASSPAAALPDDEQTISYKPPAAAPVMDDTEGLEVIGEPTMSVSPSSDAGFPDFEVEPTVAMAPTAASAAPAPAPAPAASSAARPAASSPEPEFEEDIEPTVLDVPPPTVVRREAAPAAPAPAKPAAQLKPDTKEDDVATVIYKRETPTPPPVPPSRPAPPAPPAPPRAAAAPPPAAPTGARPSAPRTPTPPTPARPAAPPPRARAERPAAPAAAPAMPPKRGGGSGKGALIAGGGVVLAVLAFAAYWFLLRPAPAPVAHVAAASPVPPPPSQATAPPVAQAPPSTEAPAPTTLAAAPQTTPPAIPEAVTVVRSPVPSPRVAAATPPPTLPGSKPGAPSPAAGRPGTTAATPATAAPSAAQQTAAAVASLMGQAKTAADAHNYDAAIAMYDEVLKLDAQNASAIAGRSAAVSARTAASAARKTFVPGRTVVQTEQKSKGDVTGFDSSDVSVRKSPDFQGRLEFAMNPSTLKAGDAYKLQIALVNEGKKPIKISGMTFTITVNGQKSGNPIAPKVKEVAPQQRVVLEELPGVFPEASTWMAEVLVTANKGDSLKNQLTWR